jgi:hypothetical protein
MNRFKNYFKLRARERQLMASPSIIFSYSQKNAPLDAVYGKGGCHDS